MEKFKINLSTYMILVLVLFISSCDDDLTEYPTIAYVPCEETNVVQNPYILTDFECQSNMTLPNVELVRNPSEIGINTSKFVGKYTDGTGAWDALIIDYGTTIDLSTNALFKLRIKTTVEGKLIVKLEGGTSTPLEKEVQLTADNSWKEYQFNFSNQAEENHTKMVLFFNAGVDTEGTDVYYLDNLFFDTSIDPCQGVSEDLSIVNDFDCQKNQDIPEVEKIMNPGKTTINDSDFVGKYIDEAGAWDAVIIDYASQIDLSTNNLFKIKVKAPVAGNLKVKLEGGSSNGIEKDAQITETGEWVEYTFDFSSQATENHTKIVLFFNSGVDTDGVSDVYYIDDLKFEELLDPCAGVVPDLSILNNFDCQQNVGFSGNASSQIIDNTNKSGINKSNNVLEVTDNGTDAWDHLLFDFGGAIDLSSKNVLKIKILSSKTVPLLAKLEGGTSGGSEIWGTIESSNDWTEYTFDFSSQASENHNKVVFFFNGGKGDGTATDIYYVDDVRFIESVALPTAMLYMSFENNYTDAISTNSATVVGTPGFAGVGASGNDSYEGATDSYLTFPTTGLTTAEFSATMWYKVNNDPDRAGILVMGPEDIANGGYPDTQNLRTNGFRFFRENGDNGNQRFKLNVGNGTADTWVDGGAAADVNPTLGDWIHLAFTISDSKATVYIDGVVVAQADITGVDWTGCDLLSIMSGKPRFSEWGHGSDLSSLDELKLYNKALSEQEVQEIMSN